MFKAKAVSVAAMLMFLSVTAAQAQSSGNTITVGTPTNPDIAGWTLRWNDEFDGAALNRDKWTPDVGYYLNSDPGTWGWGNDELQSYRDDTTNVYLRNGYLNLTAFKHRQNWPSIDPNRYAEYASGKVITKSKFSWKYGRIDFCASLPPGQGLWPALWMLPQSNVYGGWALSGEIDVMEAKGRLTNKSSGAIHFGGAWPDNTYLSKEYTFPTGKTITDFNVYTLIWEEAEIRWYVNGNCFFPAKNNQWRSNAPNAQGNAYAPFDQDFYIIMNLAVGGRFDNNRTPPDNALPATMRVDYVRVYNPSTTSITSINDRPGYVPSSNNDNDHTPIFSSQSINTNSAIPAKNAINLQVRNSARLYIYNINGKLKKTLRFKSGAYRIQLDDLPKGIYVAKIAFDGEMKTLKIPVAGTWSGRADL
ncbi:glucan endo-1,3-beta-glucosidase [Fibrobacteres bacterium R8-0-B4]